MNITSARNGFNKNYIIAIITCLSALFVYTGCSNNNSSNAPVGPSINITSPLNNARYYYGDEIEFRADVSDDRTASEDLDILWSSSIEGTLNQDFAASTGTVEFESASLGSGVHNIVFSVTDGDNLTSSDTVTIMIIGATFYETELDDCQ